jgi:adhesin transport system outer membrane protein
MAPDKLTNFQVYQNSIKLTQNLFNGYATTYKIKEQEYRLLSASYDYIQKVNDISFEFIKNYIEVLRNKELVVNSQKNVDIDEDILKKVKQLYESGLTTLSEVNKVESSLALAKSNLVVAQNTFENVKLNLEKTLGRKIDIESMQTPIMDISDISSLKEALVYAIKHNPSILISNYNIKLSKAVYGEKKSAYYPSLDLEVSQTYSKNLSASEGKTDAFKAMLYLKYNLFNGSSKDANMQKSISDLQKEYANRNNLKRTLIEKLSLAWVAYKKLQEQLKHLKRYEEFSNKTLELYSREYDLGRRSLLDLLSAQNDLIGANTQIINAKYNILFAKYRILDAMGILVLKVLHKDMLDNLKDIKKDSFIFSIDQDRDLIPDTVDLCDNSAQDSLKDSFGCSYYDKNIFQIERYTGFSFYDKNATLDKDSSKKLQLLFLQLMPYGFKNMKFEIYSNASYKDLNSSALRELSQKRAINITDRLLKLGVKDENIKVFVNTDDMPLIVNDNKANNSLHIVVRKLRKEEVR